MPGGMSPEKMHMSRFKFIRLHIGRRSGRTRTMAWTAMAVSGLLVVGAAAFALDTPPAAVPSSVVTPSAAPRTAPPVLADKKPLDYPGLHNVVAYGDGFWSGSVPEGEAGFKTLRDWGVKTIISVDGAVPELDRSRPLGMRYVHLPIGYNGFDEQRKLELTRAVRDLEKPIYMHCHHGKHRSAGAAGAVGVSLGWLATQEALERMKVSGTAPNYKGLYACTADAAPLAAAIIDAAPAEFPEVSRPSGLVESMVSIDEAVEHLKAIEKAGWKAPKDQPDLVPVAEAGRLADLLRLLHDDELAMTKPEEFRLMMIENANEAQLLEDGLAVAQPDAARLTTLFKIVNASCKECHVKFRD